MRAKTKEQDQTINNNKKIITHCNHINLIMMDGGVKSVFDGGLLSPPSYKKELSKEIIFLFQVLEGKLANMRERATNENKQIIKESLKPANPEKIKEFLGNNYIIVGGVVNE